MVLNENSTGRREEYDGAALDKIAVMAKNYVADEHGFKVAGGIDKNIPGGSFSDFSCGLWETMCDLVRYGYYMRIREEQINKIEEKIALMKKAETISWDEESFNS